MLNSGWFGTYRVLKFNGRNARRRFGFQNGGLVVAQLEGLAAFIMFCKELEHPRIACEFFEQSRWHFGEIGRNARSEQMLTILFVGLFCYAGFKIMSQFVFGQF